MTNLAEKSKAERILFLTSIDYADIQRNNWRDYLFSIGDNTGNLMFTTSMQWMIQNSDYDVVVRYVAWESLREFVEANSINKVIVNCANWIRHHRAKDLEIVA
jgi:hypothetical protein